jgi:hypothetical protein
MSIWKIYQRFGIFYDNLVHFSGFGIMYQEKSGNPDNDPLVFLKDEKHKYLVHCRLEPAELVVQSFETIPEFNLILSGPFGRKCVHTMYLKPGANPTLRLLFLPLQRQRCSRPERFLKVEKKNIFAFKTLDSYFFVLKNIFDNSKFDD